MNKLNRLTKYTTYEHGLINEIYSKLEKLENIEEELGVELTILFKALRDGVFVVGDDDLIYADYIKRIDYWQGSWTFISNEQDLEVCIEDYGVTWALTSEELELKEDK